MQKQKKTVGIGTLTLLLALLGSICLIKVNGNPLIYFLPGFKDLNSLVINSIIFVIITLAALTLGWFNKQHWGTKLGLIWCILNLISGISEIKNLFS